MSNSQDTLRSHEAPTVGRVNDEEIIDGTVEPVGNDPHVTVPRRWGRAGVTAGRTLERTEGDDE